MKVKVFVKHCGEMIETEDEFDTNDILEANDIAYDLYNVVSDWNSTYDYKFDHIERID